MAKIKCPNKDHNDQNPSAEVYPDGIYCFSCGYYEKGEYEVKKKEPEDIKKTIVYIETLPVMYIRELVLHADRDSYYIVWPDGSYYKKRPFTGGTRYIGPVGHQAPLFVVEEQPGPLVLIEGEINALSFKSAIPEFKGTIASPGSCNEFMRHILTYSRYSAIVIVCDKDAAGVAAGVELKRELLNRGKKVTLVACSKDINQMLIDGGKEEVQNWWKMEVQAGL